MTFASDANTEQRVLTNGGAMSADAATSMEKSRRTVPAKATKQKLPE
ncbi:hypothetical protein SAMN04488074_116109 [Lentzea albidocapillata subsp. violacea]|uniref:Uncharacterized protein n=1 Tax=Lentzea albidocapillata subsp. violacea TaxID=128104 RepID=A0A1G9QCN0_9PSEU|nr:hypothetical protein [Lentzea albidocapillata]SDM08822.1 hypothetical protein SAMN04488074_116109 [Lentzea albidocapillata subsp. violacea]